MPAERVRIERIAAGGDGVGRMADGRVVFVPRTAPGDLVEVGLTRTAARFARGTAVRVLEAGPDRIEPACRHYREDGCGGCQLQHLEASAQQRARRAIAGDALRRIGRLEVADPPLTTGGPEWGYRAKVTLARGRDGAIGYHRFDQPGRIFPLASCPIAAAGINALWGGVEVAALPANLERLVLRLDRIGGRHLVLETGEGRVWQGGRSLFAALGSPTDVTVWWRPPGGAARAVAGSATAYPATAFEQINPAMGDQVRRHAVASAGPLEGRRAWDLYAGIGETSDLLAEAGATVTSVERDGGAVAEAARRQQRFGPAVERIAASAERAVGSLGPADLVVANPPRAGLAREVVEAVRHRAPARFVYVSCDPATLARDLALLCSPGPPGYRLAEVAAFDLFPQTAHVETVAVLERG